MKRVSFHRTIYYQERFFHSEKLTTLFKKDHPVLASSQELPYPRLEKHAVNAGIQYFSSHTQSFLCSPGRKSLPVCRVRPFTIPYSGKVWSLERYTVLQENSDGAVKLRKKTSAMIRTLFLLLSELVSAIPAWVAKFVVGLCNNVRTLYRLRWVFNDIQWQIQLGLWVNIDDIPCIQYCTMSTIII